jgi:hypothetical protein
MTTIETDTWYRIERTRTSEDSWDAYCDPLFNSAASAFDHIRKIRIKENDYQYRVVEVIHTRTTTPIKEEKPCGYPGCLEPETTECENCDTRFCSDHGTKGGDREGDGYRLTEAVPSCCWKCGGYNADE